MDGTCLLLRPLLLCRGRLKPYPNDEDSETRGEEKAVANDPSSNIETGNWPVDELKMAAQMKIHEDI